MDRRAAVGPLVLMSHPTAAEILAAALALPREERARLAGQLLASLDECEDPGAAEAWVAELERRVAHVRAGSVPHENWADVRARLRARWRDPRGPR